MKEQSPGFWSDIAKMVADKLLIGILLLGVGFFANTTIEKFKSEQAFTGELNKLRVQKIGEVWEKVYVFEATVEPTFKAFEGFIDPTDPTAIQTARKRLEDTRIPFEGSKQEALNLADKNRFWIGEDHHAAIRAYIDASVKYYELLYTVGPDTPELEESRRKREEKRSTIIQVRSALLKQ